MSESFAPPFGRNDHYRRFVTSFVSRAMANDDDLTVQAALMVATEAAEHLWERNWFQHKAPQPIEGGK